jgi:hypothetical protein
MKLKTYIIAGVGAALLGAIIPTVSAQTTTPITGWGTEAGNQNGSAVTSDDGNGNFSMTGASPTGNDDPRALFSTINLSVGDTITLSGSFTSTSGSLGNDTFRFGLYNSNGQNTGTLSGGLWSGATSTGWLGYMVEPGSFGGGTTKLNSRNNPNSGDWSSGTGSSTIQTISGTSGANAGTYAFNLTLTLASASQLNISYFFNQTAGGTYATSGSFADTAPSTTSFNAAGFLINGSDGPTPFTFNNVDVTVTPVPEPATLGVAMLGGVLCLMFRRRRQVS